jgi:hypothetical protein
VPAGARPVRARLLALWFWWSFGLLLAGAGASAGAALPDGMVLELRSAMRSLPGQTPVGAALPDALGGESGASELRRPMHSTSTSVTHGRASASTCPGYLTVPACG